MKAKSAYLEKGRKYPSIKVFYADGSQRRISKKCSWEYMEQLYLVVRDQIAAGTFKIENYRERSATSKTLGEAAIFFISHRERQKELGEIAKGTLESDILALKKFIKVMGKNLDVQKIEQDEIREFALRMTKDERTKHGKPYKMETIKGHLRHVSIFFNWALEKGYAQKNPIIGQIRKLGKSTEEKKRRYLLREEVELLRKYYAEKPAWQLDVFNFALWTSARESEILDIKVQDYLVIPQQDHVVRVIKIKGKGNKVRHIPLYRICAEMLEKRINILKNEKKLKEHILYMKLDQNKQRAIQRAKDGYIFFEIGNRNTVSESFRVARRDLGLPEQITFHSTRHSVATDQLTQGTDIKTVSAFLGHADVRTTEIYGKIVDQKLQEIMEHTKPI
ncbi:MAG: tyrosine-type recombinase/integrase [candidate division KSB1 bacterium]|nr:tyrosine-type recombinase/integrase [candidate division KSB1 bacterium]